MNRTDARATGAKRYIGRPCRKHGAKAERYTSTKSCVECDRVAQGKRRKAR